MAWVQISMSVHLVRSLIKSTLKSSCSNFKPLVLPQPSAITTCASMISGTNHISQNQDDRLLYNFQAPGTMLETSDEERKISYSVPLEIRSPVREKSL